MSEYENLLESILDRGINRNDRTGTGTLELFAPNPMRFDLSEGFPIVMSKYVNFDVIVKELLWIMSGSTNINDLDSKIWDQWSDSNGDLGPIYGEQLRNHSSTSFYDKLINHNCDPLLDIINEIKTNPNSRRLVISLWNHSVLPIMNKPSDNPQYGKQALACCHGTVIQFNVNNGKLDMYTHQRSADVFLGLPFNISSYALFLSMIASVTGYEVGEMIYSLGSAHIYHNHFVQIEEVLNYSGTNKLPNLKLTQFDNIENYRMCDISLDWTNTKRNMNKIFGKVAV